MLIRTTQSIPRRRSQQSLVYIEGLQRSGALKLSPSHHASPENASSSLQHGEVAASFQRSKLYVGCIFYPALPKIFFKVPLGHVLSFKRGVIHNTISDEHFGNAFQQRPKTRRVSENIREHPMSRHEHGDGNQRAEKRSIPS